MSTPDDITKDLMDRILKLTELKETGDIEPEEYERRMAELRKDIDAEKQEAVRQYSESLKPYIENNIPLENPLVEVNVVETFLFSRLSTHWAVGEDPYHPSGIDYPPYFSLGAAALHGASYAYGKMLADSDYLLEGGYGIHNTNAFKLLEEGHTVSHDDYVSQLAILTMPLLNRFFWLQGKRWRQSKSHFDQYRRSVTEMYYDYLFDEPDGSKLSDAHSTLCGTLYEYLESDNERTNDESPYALKPTETLYLTMLLTENIGGEDTTEEEPTNEDLIRIASINSLGMRKTAEVLLTDWPENWPYGAQLAPTYNMFIDVLSPIHEPERRSSPPRLQRQAPPPQSGSNGGCLGILIVLLISTVGGALGGYLLL